MDHKTHYIHCICHGLVSTTFCAQSSVAVSVWNTQWLLGTLMGVDHSRVGEMKGSECSTQPATIQEVDEEEEEDTSLQITSNSLDQRVSADIHSQRGPLFSGTCT